MKKLEINISNKMKLVLIFSGYILLTEIIKSQAEVYAIERSLELKLFVLSIIVVFLYDASYYLLFYATLFLIVLDIFGMTTGLMIYVLVCYAFIKLLREARKS